MEIELVYDCCMAVSKDQGQWHLLSEAISSGSVVPPRAETPVRHKSATEGRVLFDYELRLPSVI